MPSLRPHQTLVSHDPSTIVGKAGGRFIGAAIPTGGHHSDRVEQSSVAREVSVCRAAPVDPAQAVLVLVRGL